MANGNGFFARRKRARLEAQVSEAFELLIKKETDLLEVEFRYVELLLNTGLPYSAALTRASELASEAVDNNWFFNKFEE